MTTCPRCGASLAETGGSCPRCLLALGIEGEPASRPPVSPTDPTLSLAAAPTYELPPECESAARPPSTPRFAARQTLGPYRLVRVLGAGGFGEVWEAEDQRDQRRVALKLLTEDLSATARERFRREGRIAASIHHPRVVFLFSAEELAGVPALAMELVPGGTLKDLVERSGPLPWRDAVARMLELIDGLEAAHGKGILHRDIKPSNCFLDERGQVKIGDFGLSRPTEGGDDYTKTGTYVGTPAFSSPEQVKGAKLDVRSDLFSLGATLYYLLCGRAPFEGETLGQVLAKVLAEEPKPLRELGVDLPPGLGRLFDRLLAKKPADRPPAYSALRTLLLPYSQRRLRAGEVGLRLIAYWIDRFILGHLAAFAFALLPTAGLASLAHSIASRTPLQLATLATATFVYFAVLERYFARTPGKAVTGLAVRAADGSPVTARTAATRSAAFAIFDALATLASSLAAEGREWPAVALMLVLFGAAFGTVRRGNGYRAGYELVSRTRVTREPLWRSPETRRSPGVPDWRQRASSIDGLPERLGPFPTLARLGRGRNGDLLLGTDPVLGRDVWLFLAAIETPYLRPEHGVAAKTFGPPRLQSGTLGGRPWDAYAAPPGEALLAWVERDGSRSWPEARHLLKQLASALAAGRESWQPLSLKHLWVTPDLTLYWLPFEAPGASQREVHEYSPGDWQPFVLSAASWLLEGRLVDHAAFASTEPQTLSPACRALLGRLADGLVRSPDELAGLLGSLPSHSLRVSRASRGVALVAAGLPFLFVQLSLLDRLDPLRGLATHFWLASKSLFFAALAGLLFSATFSTGGLSLQLTGLTVVRRDGSPTGRLRRLVRAALAWSPVLISPLAATLNPRLDYVSMTCFFAAAAFAWLSPQRGLQDHLAGTAVVAR